MKIIHVVAYYPPHLGGMENTVKELAERTAALGHNVLVLTSNRIESKLKEKSKKNLTIKYMKSLELFHTPIIPELPIELLKQANKNTIIHIHFAIALIPEIAILCSKLKGAKIVTHIHLDPMPSGKMGIVLPFFKKIWRLIIPDSDIVICPTSDYVDIISSNYNVNKNRCVIIPSGIDLTQYKRKKKIPKSVQNVLFVGRLAPQKNLHMLLKAFILINKKNIKNIKLHIVGSGEDENSLKKIILKEKLTNVILHGRVSDDKLKDLYINSDLFILPSIKESFGMVLIEAMANNLPIIASDIPGVRNVLSECGILVKPTPENFANSIIKLKDDEIARYKLVEKYEKILKDYDWNIVVKKIIDTYNKIEIDKV